MIQNIFKFIFSTFEQAFALMNPKLSNYHEFSKALSKQVKVKDNENVQYNFDIELDELVKKQITHFDILGRIFSEESGFFEVGEKKYRVVYDPFCNSSLATRTFLDAAIGISIFNYDYKFITSAIMDFQTGVVGIVENSKTNFYQIQNREKINFDFAVPKDLENAWTVITLENRDERNSLDRAEKILTDSGRIIVSSGHIYWLRLATGAIDAYLDPFGGERLYEMFACTVAQGNGCIVTDLKGKKFNAEENLKIFDDDPDYIYYPVAARNKELHSEITVDSLFPSS